MNNIESKFSLEFLNLEKNKNINNKEIHDLLCEIINIIVLSRKKVEIVSIKNISNNVTYVHPEYFFIKKLLFDIKKKLIEDNERLKKEKNQAQEDIDILDEKIKYIKKTFFPIIILDECHTVFSKNIEVSISNIKNKYNY